MFLENETWQLCPVIEDFSIFKLQEYKFLKNSTSNGKSSQLVFKEYYLNNNDQLSKANVSTAPTQINVSMKDLLSVDNPFEVEDTSKTDLANGTENIFNSSEPSTGHVDHEANRDQNNIPIITYTSLNIIRLFGKYIHMLSIFKIISQQVISYLMQLFYFYLYYVYFHFVSDEVIVFLV
jgi:hypothetical protein